MPEDYTRLFDYSAYQNANPTKPLPGVRVNIDLDDVHRAISETNTAVRTVVSPSGGLLSGSVGLTQLTAGALADIAVNGGSAVIAAATASAAAALASQTAAAGSATTAGSSATTAGSSATAAAASAVAAAASAANARVKLAAPAVYYVRTDGSDSNNGLANTSGGAFLTIQKAVDAVFALDLAGFNATINLGAGTYTGATTITGIATGQTKNSIISIVGDIATPANVLISTTSVDAFTITGGARISISGVKVQTATSGNCFTTQFGSFLTLASFTVGACATYQISTAYHSMTTITSTSYTISGNAVGHYYTTLNSVLLTISNTVTLTGTPAFGTAFLIGAVNSYSHVVSVTFSGSATGQRFYMYMNAVYSDGSANGRSYLPGSTEGTTFAGAVYNNDEEFNTWNTWTPTIATVSSTSATAFGQYKIHGKDLHFNVAVTITAAGSSGSLNIPLPTTNTNYAPGVITAARYTRAFAALDSSVGQNNDMCPACVFAGQSAIFLGGSARASGGFTNAHIYVITGVIELT